MSVISSMSTAISGLQAHGEAMGVVSDNIVNANTTGFKTSRAEFHSILAQDLLAHGTGVQIGRGATLAGVTNVFTQGPITHSDRSTDLAINGNGFFVLRNDVKGMTYTRDGSFRFDKDGWLTTLKGTRVQAYAATPEGKVTGKLTDVRLPFNTVPAKATNELQLHVNLDARLPVTLPLDPNRPDDTAQFNTAAQIYDSIGNAHALTVYFNKIADSTWEFSAMTDGANLLGGEVGKPQTVVGGTLIFDQEGKLQSVEQNVQNTTFANGAIPDQQMLFNFGDALDQQGTGVAGTTQYGSKSNAFRNIQDGWSAGNLVDTSIDADGVIAGIYNNGLMKVLGQLAVARFEATERLSKFGDNQFRETIESGRALIGLPNSNGRGQIMTKSLEQSNVDIAKEFVDMIKIQRGFQASAKSITTANEMLDEVINLKRQ